MPDSTSVRALDASGLSLPFDKHRVHLSVIADYEGGGVQFSVGGGRQVLLAPGAVWNPHDGIMSAIEFSAESEGTVIVS